MINTINSSRLTQLNELLVVLAEAIDDGPGARDLSQLAKQYRETLAEIEELRNKSDDSDEIGEMLQEREASGKSGTVRASRSGL